VISYPEAQAIVLKHCSPLGIESRPLATARNFILAADIRTPFQLPRFDHSAVDGYAIRTDDVAAASTNNPIRLQVIDTVKTGYRAVTPVTQGCAVRIFTGAMLPEGVDGVVMVEDVEFKDEFIQLTAPLKSNKNIRRTGEEFAEGEVCLRSGSRLTPPAIGLAATLGCRNVTVYRKPRIAVIVTGSELVDLGLPLGEAQIYDSNRIALTAALCELGIDDVTAFTCPDDETSTRERIVSAFRDADIVITSGGASVGDVDYVKPAITNLGGTIHFDKVAIKPGKPTVFAEVAGNPLFGLPGNPVSALVTYLLFVRPALLKIMGDIREPFETFLATLSSAISKRSARTEFVRARKSSSGDRTIVTPCSGQESHMMGGLAAADSLIVFEGEAGSLPAGSAVCAISIGWS